MSSMDPLTDGGQETTEKGIEMSEPSTDVMVEEKGIETPDQSTDALVEITPPIVEAADIDRNKRHIDSGGWTLSSQEEQLYDRQIRLWGIEVQQRIMNARVLFLGKNGIQEEAIKNLILAGMRVTLANSSTVTEGDVQCSFFLQAPDIGKNHAEALIHRMQDMVLNKDRVQFINSSVLKETTVNGVLSYEIDDSMLSRYDVISLAAEDFPISKLVHVNEKCRQQNVAFFASLGNGTHGFIFQDLNNHTVLEKTSKMPGSVNIQYRSLGSILAEPKFPRNCDVLIRKTVAYLLIQNSYSETITNPSCVLDLKDRLEDICNAVGTNINDVLPLFRLQGKGFAVTSGVLGGYIALTIRNFVTKQYETAPSLCVFDMNRSIVTTAMI